MIKRFVILRRKPEMSTEEFRQYWKNIHGPLIAKIPALIKYVQYHVHSERLDNTDDPIDGIAEPWFESEKSQHKAYQTRKFQAVVKDESNLFEMNSHYLHPVRTEEIVNLV
jgi:uncharacterized protein (TIGR02118 family)